MGILLVCLRHDTLWMDSYILRTDKGGFPRRHTGELKCLYGCGISNTTPNTLPPPAPAKVMASSKRGNKQVQSLLSHWRGSWAQGGTLGTQTQSIQTLRFTAARSRLPASRHTSEFHADGLQQTDTPSQEALGRTNHAPMTGRMISAPAAIN